jgi:hypothetical protein
MTKHKKKQVVIKDVSVSNELISTIELPKTLSKKLYLQNFNKYFRTEHRNCCGKLIGYIFRFIPPANKLKTIIIAADKYTIVELIYNGKHYHGLSAKANCDRDVGITGIAIAYNRAFQKLCGVIG